ncbi:RES family NAD+ phosphorylase [Oceanicella sp. SM1341]|uniref:RES family NAD+ phosphorylase n=1 Tax=Oceanicella sp. SM1341 TaxID=1548889 RepID=UPI000E4A5B9A|nr:RES domain-containing protein [Oceanicella sp. SM1341]
MTPLPFPLEQGPLTAWRIDHARFAASWDSGEGAFRVGGRWNTPRRRAVYCAFDPATAILEVAVHKGFALLDATPSVLTALEVLVPRSIRVVRPEEVPNPGWLVPGYPGAGQMRFGDALLAEHGMIAIPSTVSRRSWNLVFDPEVAAGRYRLLRQEPLALDTRLNPPPAAPGG